MNIFRENHLIILENHLKRIRYLKKNIKKILKIKMQSKKNNNNFVPKNKKNTLKNKLKYNFL